MIKCLIFSAFEGRKCERRTSTREISAVELVNKALVHEDSVIDSQVHQEDADDVGIEDYDYVNAEDYVDDDDGVDAKLSTEENRKEVMEHH